MGKILIEGKTKKVVPIEAVRLIAKDDITAGNGAKHDLLEGKAEYATTTTCRVFELLKHCGLPVAYYAQDTPTSFIAPLCRMLMFEVVVRREAHGSYLKRYPNFEKGQRFEELLVEFFLKTNNNRWGKYDNLECDDPLVEFEGDEAWLYNPAKPYVRSNFFLRIPARDIAGPRDREVLKEAGVLAKKGFLILEKGWDLLDHRKLVDFKGEFGIGPNGELLWADVMDNDSWRLIEDEQYIDKQRYRDDDELDIVLANYRHVADLAQGLVASKEQIKAWYESIES